MKLIMISAIAANGVIGNEEKGLPWHVPEEFKHFKDTTFGHPVIMGKVTWKELGKPLKGRLNIVLSKDEPITGEEVISFPSIEEALAYCRGQRFGDVYIIGGKSVYTAMLPMADEMILSFMKFNADGTIKFPEFDPSHWEVTNESDREKFTIRYYKRKR